MMRIWWVLQFNPGSFFCFVYDFSSELSSLFFPKRHHVIAGFNVDHCSFFEQIVKLLVNFVNRLNAQHTNVEKIMELLLHVQLFNFVGH